VSNPYQAPEIQDVQAIPVVNAEAAAIRTFHISHEASVKGVGALYILGGLLMAFGTISALQMGQAGNVQSAGSLAYNSVFAIAGIIAGFGLRKLRPWARLLTIVLSVISLLSSLLAVGVSFQAGGAAVGAVFAGLAIGGAINAYIIYLMASSKGRMVFSPEYKEVIAQTPGIKYRSKVLLIFLLIILALIVVGGLAAVFLLR
jgi:hypothetical protein